MDSPLATTGTVPLLEQLSPFIPDDFINELCRWKRRSGPRPLYGPAQLFRVHLLALLTSAHSFNLLIELLKENRSRRRFAFLSHRHRVPDAKMLHQFRDQLGVGGLRAINRHLLMGLLDSCRPDRKTVAIIDSTDLPAATNAYKKRDGGYTATGATLGGRTRKHGHSRWFVGYKKHTLRLWLHAYDQGVLLVPLISWLAPGHRGDALFLRPSLRWCQQHLLWLPDIVLADMAYINLETQRWIREHWQVCVLTKLRPDMKLVRRFEPGPIAVCHQGQRLEWLGFEPRDQLHWFGVNQHPALCDMCWEQHSCPRYFAHAPKEHEILFGSIPLSSPVAQKLITEVRAWAEACQSYEKNQLGLKRMFFNSLRLTWMLGLLADSVSLLRAKALLTDPQPNSPLQGMLPHQLNLDLASTA